MSRAKFEEWLNKPCSAIEDPVAWVVSDVDSIAYQAWLAGRESMRDEAAKSCEDKADRIYPEGKRSNQVDRHVADVLDRHADEIRKIAP